MIALLAALLAIINSPYTPPSYNCDGVTATYTVSFPYLAYTDLVVTTTTSGGSVTTLVYTTDYTVNLTSTQTTATLTLNSPSTKCPVNNILKIARNTALTQPTSFRAQTNYNQTLHEQAYDRIEMQVQESYGVSSKQTGPLSGDVSTPSTSSGVTTFRAFVAGDIPNLSASKITSGTLTQAVGGTGASALTCAAGDVLTSNGTVYSCTTPSIINNLHSEGITSGSCSTIVDTPITTVNITVTGTYLIIGHATFTAAATGNATLKILQNSTAITGAGGKYTDNSGTGVSLIQMASVIAPLVSGDVLKLACKSVTTAYSFTADGWSLAAVKLQ